MLAPGEIAADFVATLHANSDQRVVAVGSRSLDRATAFADRFDVPAAYGSYEEAVSDPRVDVFYIASVNSEHLALALLAIEAGKHVLIEKPLALTEREARRIADAAGSAGVFAGEAMWSRYLPHIQRAAEIMESGALGDIRLAAAHVGWRIGPADSAHRLLVPELGGGTILDTSVYGFWLVQFALGHAQEVRAFGTFTSTGVDEQVTAALRMGHGVHGSVTSTMAVDSSGFASIEGTAGSIRFGSTFLFPSDLHVLIGDQAGVWTDPSGLVGRDGLVWQAVAVAKYIAEGRLESPLHSLADSIALARTMDAVRAQVATV